MTETFRRERAEERLEFTGERLTGTATGQVEIEHLHRYFLARDFCRGLDVLDIASGEGYGAAILAQVARIVVGVDISEEAVHFAARNYRKDNLSFRVGDARNIPMPDAAVDVVVSFETIEHLDEQAQFLTEIKRVLRPGGLLVMSSPDRDVYASGRETANPFHVRELSATEFTSLLSRHFTHVVASGQRCFLGSALLPLQGQPAGVRSFERRSEAMVEAADGPGRAVYVIALASDHAIDGAATSIYVHSLDVDGAAGRITAMQDDLQQERAVLGGDCAQDGSRQHPVNPQDPVEPSMTGQGTRAAQDPYSLMDQFRIKAREPLFFMHIPKTAGMSMRLYLSEQYQADDVCPIANWRDLLGHEQELASFRLVQGHFRYNLRKIVAPDARMLVILREPIRRTISVLRHLRRDPNFHLDYDLARNLSLSEMLRHPAIMRNLYNAQARFLCASMDPAIDSAYLKKHLADDAHADAGDLDGPPELQLAIDRLASISFVGLTEDIGTVVSTMAQQMNYHPPLYFPFINEDPTRSDPLQDLTDADLSILHAHNEIDLQVYKYAGKLIERRAFERDMGRLIHSGVYSVPPGSFEIPISGIMPGSGWYKPEHKDGVFWRWTGPDRYFTIEVPLRSDKSYRLTLAFAGKQPPEIDCLASEVNDVVVTFEPPQEGSEHSRKLVIPQALLAKSSGFCRIRFDTSKTARRTETDIRALGVSVSRILFEALE